jgi:cell division protein FtsL
MSKKTRKKKNKATNQTRSVPAKKNAKYSPGEIAMAVLGAALVIMVGVIIVTSMLE